MTVTIDESSTRTLTVPPEAWNTPAPRKRGKKPLISFGHWWWAMPAVLLVIAVHYVATLTGGFFAFTNWTGLGDWDFVGLENFQRIFQDPLLLGAVWNTLFLAFASVILTNVLGLLFALAINRMSQLGTPVQGVTLYSFTRAFHGREYDLEGLVRKVAADGYGPGLEIIGFSSFRGFPEIDDRFAGWFRDLVDEVGLVTTSLAVNADIGIHRDRLLTQDELIEYM